MPTAQRPIEEPPEPTKAAPAEMEELARSLGDLFEDRHSASAWIPNLRRLHIDQARVEAAGIRKVSGPRLTLYTDLPELEAIDRLPEIVAQAFPQWCEFFRIDPAAWPDWELTGFLMKDKARFDSAGLIPRYLPEFEHGFSWNYEFWLYEQPSDYYRRHLTLHEGTHCFMNTILGSCGPSWYMEATAELLATHRFEENRLSMNHFPDSREEVPMWGRIRIAKDAYDERRAKTFDSIIQDRGPYLQQNEPYAWRWAVAALLDRHPRYHDRFRMLSQFVTNRRFTDRFYETFDEDLQTISEEWQVFVANMEYGHDVAKTAIDFTPGLPLAEPRTTLDVATDRGWQNSGLILEEGLPYSIRAEGRYQVDDQPQIWWCEPGGVSIRYYQGRPLGELLGAVWPGPVGAEEVSPLVHPVPIGLGTTLTPERSGTLFLKINDSAAELDNNQGTMQVEITRSRP